MNNEDFFKRVYLQVYYHLILSGIYKKNTCTKQVRDSSDTIDKEVIFSLDKSKLSVRLSSRSKILIFQNEEQKISVSYEDLFCVKTILKTPLLLEKLIYFLYKGDKESTDLQTLSDSFRADIYNKLSKRYSLEETEDFRHEIAYSSGTTFYCAYESKRFIVEGVHTNSISRYSLYARHPKYLLASLESKDGVNNHQLMTSLLDLMVNIQFAKLSSISFEQALPKSLYDDKRVLDTTTRHKVLYKNYQSFTGINMVYVPDKNLGFYISRNLLNQQEFQSLLIYDESSIQSERLEVNNLTQEVLGDFVSLINNMDIEYNYLIPSIKQIKWVETLISSQWNNVNYHQGLGLFDFDESKAFWVRDEDMTIRKYRSFHGFDDNFSLEHTSCKLVAIPKK